MAGTLTCPVCRNPVLESSSMCFSCHLPNRDVRDNQKLARRGGGRSLLSIALIGALLAAGVIAYRTQQDSPPADEPGRGGATQVDREIDYSALDVRSSEEMFDGTVELTNHTDLHADVMVEVHVYDGDQEIGSLSGDVSLKPNSSAVADLTSLDEFQAFSDTVVELIAIPAFVAED